MNLPNQLTCLRLFLTVCFAFLIFLPGALFKSLALAVFLLASITDYWDGKIARERNLITQFGQLMDPIADKALVLAALFSFVWMGMVELWMVLVVVARDLFVTGWRLVVPMDGKAQSARKSGKYKTVLQFVFIVSVLIYATLKEMSFWRVDWTLTVQNWVYFGMLLIVAMTAWSGIHFILQQKKSDSK